MDLILRQLGPDDPALADILALIRQSFAYMENVIDPPSSMIHLTPAAVSSQAAKAEVWSLGPPLAACAFFTPKPQALYLGKIAVAADMRGKGLSRRLVEHGAERAKALGLPLLELESRIELTDNHAAFYAMGFAEVARTAHPGFDRPTSIVFQRPVA
ncbi:Acetyltransferase, gnat family [Sulfitobacter noctilucicola]|uniref:GNAT superfamily N-acetyltransferase n=1 Tax=Sulfitobacter noctilucicola TaxID=1342301 RepID=A0A7W6Q2Q2_9RHOB|nr:GNAT family N-acetyltransferase [Sulfitobacter noctilucicola]KIN63206.1 Acetyltransferase, gnat family [Sulfitobacter noctilucicola]MBB4172269.1 GNAT superfamily N-acetyltransferase [Sulfitobacter noctilucicola]